MVDKRITRINDYLASIDPGQTAVDLQLDADLGYYMYGVHTHNGEILKLLAKDKPGQLTGLTLTGLPASDGLVRHTSTGLLVGGLITSGVFNALISDTDFLTATSLNMQTAYDGGNVVQVDVTETRPFKVLGQTATLIEAGYDFEGTFDYVGISADLTLTAAFSQSGGEFSFNDVAENFSVAADVISLVSDGASSFVSGSTLFLKDIHLSDPVTLSESGEAVLGTISDSIVGAINEVLGLIATHASVHENGGTGEISVAGLSGLLADPQIPLAHASTHYDGAADEIAHNLLALDGLGTSHYASSPSVGSYGILISQTAFVGSTDAAGVVNRDIALLRSRGTDSTSQPRSTTITGNYEAVWDAYATDTVAVFDRNSWQEINRVATSAGLGPMTDVANGFAILDGTNITVYTVPDLSVYNTVSFPVTVYACDTGFISGKIYAARDTGVLYRRLSDGSSDGSGTLPSLTGVPCALLISDDEQIAYVIDGPAASSGDVYLRVYNISTLTTPTLTGSVQLVSSVNGEQYAVLGWANGYIATKTTHGGGATTGKIHLLDVSTPSSPSIAFTSSESAITSYYDCIRNGLWCSPVNDTLRAYQLPALTSEVPHFEDRLGGNGLESADGYKDTDGNDITITKQDRIRTVVEIQPLIANQFGAVIESVETGEPNPATVETANLWPVTPGNGDTTTFSVYIDGILKGVDTITYNGSSVTPGDVHALISSDCNYVTSTYVGSVFGSVTVRTLLHGSTITVVVGGTDTAVVWGTASAGTGPTTIVGQWYLMDSTSTWYPNCPVRYGIDGWHIYRPYHGASLRDACGQYTREYYTDRWIKKVDMVLTATVTGDGATTITDIMTLDVGDTLYPLLQSTDASDSEFWDVRIEVTAVVVSGDTPSGYSGGKWVLDAFMQQGYGGISQAYINGNATSKAMTAVDTAPSFYETPSVAIVDTSGTGDLRITVGVNSGATTYDYQFNARIVGESRLGAPRYE